MLRQVLRRFFLQRTIEAFRIICEPTKSHNHFPTPTLTLTTRILRVRSINESIERTKNDFESQLEFKNHQLENACDALKVQEVTFKAREAAFEDVFKDQEAAGIQFCEKASHMQGAKSLYQAQFISA